MRMNVVLFYFSPTTLNCTSGTVRDSLRCQRYCSLVEQVELMLQDRAHAHTVRSMSYCWCHCPLLGVYSCYMIFSSPLSNPRLISSIVHCSLPFDFMFQTVSQRNSQKNVCILLLETIRLFSCFLFRDLV